MHQNKLLYVQNSLRTVRLPNGDYGPAQVYGTASLRTGTIRLTSLLWENFSGDALIDRIDYDIVHELQHLMLNTTAHPIGFESAINRWGYYKGGILDAF